MVSMNLTTRGSVDITTVWVRAPPRKYLTPSSDSPAVIPVAAKTTSVPRMRSSSRSFRSGSPKPDSSNCSTWARCVGRKDSLGGAADADDRVQVSPTHPNGDGRGEVALGSDLDARSRPADLPYEALVPVAVEDGHGYLRRPAAERPGDVLHVLLYARVYVDAALRPRAHYQLAHVHIRRPEHAPPRGRRDGGDGSLLPLDEQLQALDGLDGEVGFGPAGAERVARAHHAVGAPGPADPPFLVQALLAQHRHPAGDGDLSQLLQKSFGGERVGPLGVSRPFEPGHLQGDPLGHGGILHGSRSYGSRMGIGNANGLSPNLHTHYDGPQATGISHGWVCVETVRTGPLP